MNVYVKHFIPIAYDVSKDVNKHLSDLGPFWDRISDICGKLIFDEVGKNYYGYFFHLFVLIIIADTIFFRKFNREAVTLLYGIAVVYFGLALIGFLLPLADLMHTTKRGLFKLLPLILLYYRDSGLLLKLSELLRNWEQGIGPEKPKPVRTPTRPVATPAKPAAGRPATPKR